MSDEYLTWLETRITEVLDAQSIFDNGTTPKIARDIEKILETLIACKGKYTEFNQNEFEIDPTFPKDTTS